MFWVLEVHCAVDDHGDVKCTLHTTTGTNVICEDGGEESHATERLDIKPRTDFECRYPLKEW